ncbi:hypothetical protein BD779DRAFT_1764163 [Infundibulicybe gibba]|nr:hypothetical protein BD779DRAFT_1764163 [Infundibulicybe gibba]
MDIVDGKSHPPDGPTTSEYYTRYQRLRDLEPKSPVSRRARRNHRRSSPQVFGTSSNTTHECFIDGTSIGSTPGPQTLADGSTIESDDLLCDGTKFTDGKEHILSSIALVHYITYIPSAPVQPESAIVLVDRLNPAIVYNLGTSVSWVGYTPLSNQSTSATYSIDGGEPELFRLNGSSRGLLDQMFFTSPNLSPGPHSLEVVYQGDNTTLPLTLNHFVIANNGTTSSQPPSVSSIIATGSDKSNGSAPVGAIIGGVIGGIAGSDISDGHSTPLPHITPFEAMPSAPAMTEAGNGILKVQRPLMAGPTDLLGGPSSDNNPNRTPWARNSNQRKVPPRISPIETSHETRSIPDEAIDPPPSYVSE